jgi:hypothetical protein
VLLGAGREWISVADVRQSYWRTTDDEVETSIEDPLEDLTRELAEEAWVPEARRILTRVAGTYHAVINYSDLAAEIQETSGVRSRLQVRTWIGPVLAQVAHDNHDRDEPALTALVVHKTDGTVGAGYDEVLTLTGVPAIDDPLAREKHAAAARLACYEWAGADLPTGGGKAALSPRYDQIQARLRKERRAAEQPAICATCFMAIPPTGLCDNCD